MLPLDTREAHATGCTRGNTRVRRGGADGLLRKQRSGELELKPLLCFTMVTCIHIVTRNLCFIFTLFVSITFMN